MHKEIFKLRHPKLFHITKKIKSLKMNREMNWKTFAYLQPAANNKK